MVHAAQMRNTAASGQGWPGLRGGDSQRARKSFQSRLSTERPRSNPSAPAPRATASPSKTVMSVKSLISKAGTNVVSATVIAPSTAPNTIRSSRVKATPER